MCLSEYFNQTEKGSGIPTSITFLMKTNRLEFNLASTESRDMDNEEQVLFMDIYSRSRQRNDCVMI